jgi:hypothetical protein
MYFNIETRELTDIKPIELMYGDEKAAALKVVGQAAIDERELELMRVLLVEEERLLAEQRDHEQRMAEQQELITWYKAETNLKMNIAKFIAPSLMRKESKTDVE